MVESAGVDLDALGERIRHERARRRLSLSELAAKAGVSRSMLSAVERGSKAPTVLVLDRIATGLDTSIARLLGEERAGRVILLRHGDQEVARDRAGWERRILSPVLPGIEFELMRTTLGAGVDAGVFAAHAPGSREYLAVERGTHHERDDQRPFRAPRLHPALRNERRGSRGADRDRPPNGRRADVTPAAPGAARRSRAHPSLDVEVRCADSPADSDPDDRRR